MSKPLSIFTWILVGALASGIGIGFFLHAANQDRSRLEKQAIEARAQAERATAESERVAKEANTKLAAAATEVAQAKERLSRIDEFRALTSKAVKIQAPSASTLKYWSTGISVPLGLSVRVPTGSASIATDKELILSLSPLADKTDDQWLIVQAYNGAQEAALLTQLQNAQSAVFASGSYLFAGQRGTMDNTTGAVFVLHTFSETGATLLLWGNASSITEKRFLETLATLAPRS